MGDVIHGRRVLIAVLVLAALFAGGGVLAAKIGLVPGVAARSDETVAETVAREYMVIKAGADAVNRSQVEVRPSDGGWMVVFHDAEAACGSGGDFWPGACRGGAASAVYRDVYACVERDGWSWRIGGAGASPQSLGPEDRCQRGGGPPAPSAAATPRQQRPREVR